MNKVERIVSPFILAATFSLISAVAAPAFQNSKNISTYRLPEEKPEAEMWSKDLNYMVDEMEKRHKNLFHGISREQFRGAVQKLHDRLPLLARHQTIVELMRIVAMVGDNHTFIRDKWRPPIAFHRYPIILFVYKDGIFVQKVSAEHAEAVRARVLKIGNASINDAYEAVRELIPHENEMAVKSEMPGLLVTPEILHALGFIREMDKASFVLEREGRRITIELKMVEGSAPPTNMVDARRDAKAPMPLWLKNPQNRFWFEYLKDTRSLYVQYNQAANKPDETVADFCKKLFAFAEANVVDRFILDLRFNNGGFDPLNRPLFLGIIKSGKIDQPGRLFVIIGRRTASAAQHLVNELEMYTSAIFVGEPTGQNVHFYSDRREFELPNSRIKVGVPIYWFQNMLPNDVRKWTAPNIEAELTSDDYRNDVDPAMNAILNYRASR